MWETKWRNVEGNARNKIQVFPKDLISWEWLIGRWKQIRRSYEIYRELKQIDIKLTIFNHKNLEYIF